MISTGTLMLGKALLTAGAALGFCFWQLHALRRLKQERRKAEEGVLPVHEARPGESTN